MEPALDPGKGHSDPHTFPQVQYNKEPASWRLITLLEESSGGRCVKQANIPLLSQVPGHDPQPLTSMLRLPDALAPGQVASISE